MKKTSIIANLAIAFVLVMLSVAVFSADLGRVYESVAAPVTNGNKNLKNVSFLVCIEADADGTVIDNFVNTLSLYKAPATFFVAGSWIMKNPQRIKKMITLNFEIGNYGFSGKNMKSLNAAKQKEEILNTHTLMKGLTGVDMKLFMPPLSEYNKDVLKAAAALGYTVVLPSRDVKTHLPDATAERIFTRSTENTKNGDLILICPTPAAIEALPSIIDLYFKQEFGIIKVSENITV